MMRKTDHVAHVQECVRFGVQPLTGHEITRLHADGFDSLEDAYSVACDLDNDWTWEQAIEALRRAADA